MKSGFKFTQILRELNKKVVTLRIELIRQFFQIMLYTKQNN